MISSIEDLSYNQTYYLVLVPGYKARKVRLLGIIQNERHTEAWIQFLEGKGYKQSITVQNFKELGLGHSPQEARDNYAKIACPPIRTAYTKDQQLEADLFKTEVQPSVFLTYNKQNIREL